MHLKCVVSCCSLRYLESSTFTINAYLPAFAYSTSNKWFKSAYHKPHSREILDSISRAVTSGHISCLPAFMLTENVHRSPLPLLGFPLESQCATVSLILFDAEHISSIFARCDLLISQRHSSRLDETVAVTMPRWCQHARSIAGEFWQWHESAGAAADDTATGVCCGTAV